MAEAIRSVRVHIESPSSVAARMPAITGVVLVPRLVGWATRPMASLITRVRGEIVRAVTANEVQLSQRSAALKSAIDDAGMNAPVRSQPAERENACKRWCVEHRNDPIALQALCENKVAPWDSSIVSMIVEASTGFGEMGRSRVLGALANRTLQLQTALACPDGVSRVLNAAQDLPWEAPGHEAIAKAVVNLDKELFYEGDATQTERFERLLGGSMSEVVASYAAHPRIAVVEVVARECDRQEVLGQIANRAESLYEMDPRMTFRLVTALASNRCTTPELLRPFANPEMWTQGTEERKALGAMLSRVVGELPKASEPSIAPSI